MTFTEITEGIRKHFDASLIKEELSTLAQPQISIDPSKLVELCLFLRDTENFYFDSLSCLTALDNGPEKGTMEVIYHLYSIPYHHSLVLKAVLPRDQATFPSLSGVWRTANWHEREAYDFFGITFIDHPDLRRILLPADWVGHPMRKDYKEQDMYHGIQVAY